MFLEKLIKDRYKVIETLGKGGFSTTFLAEDNKTSKKCVIKYTKLTKSESIKGQALFEKEAYLLSELSYHLIPKIVDFFTIEKEEFIEFFIIQEYIEGKNFSELIQSGKHFTEKDIIKITIELVRTLEYIHGFSPPIIHRDIKPQNIIYTLTRKVYLIDFGAAREKLLHNEMNKQGISTIIGTQGYMPIEQFEGNTLPASDIYSLGMTLIYLLSHKEPFQMEKKGLKYNFRPYVNISENFSKIIDKMIEADHTKRYNSAEVLKKDLEKLLSGKTIYFSNSLNTEEIKSKKLTTSITIASMLIASFLTYSFLSKKDEKPIEVKTKTNTTVTNNDIDYSKERIIGTLYFDEQPISDLTKNKPVFWFRNEDKNIVEKPLVTYSNSTGKFSIKGLPNGKFGMSVTLDLNNDNGNNYPGDLRKWETFNVSDNNLVNLEVDMQKIIHLKTPQDNNFEIEKWREKCNKYEVNSPVYFSWDSLGDNIEYDYSIGKIECNPYKNIGTAASGTTKNTSIEINLEPSYKEEYYLLKLTARKNGKTIGTLMTHGNAGLGWDYRFKVK